MTRDELTAELCKLFVKFWMLDDPMMRPKDEVIFLQASLWAEESQGDDDFKSMDSGEWAWLLKSCRTQFANSRGSKPVPTWASLCAFRKSQPIRESLSKHREQADPKNAIEPPEKQGSDAFALKMLEDDLGTFLSARELGREAAMRARGANVVIACSKLAKNGFGPQISELFDRLEGCDGAKQDLSAIKERLNVE